MFATKCESSLFCLANATYFKYCGIYADSHVSSRNVGFRRTACLHPKQKKYMALISIKSILITILDLYYDAKYHTFSHSAKKSICIQNKHHG